MLITELEAKATKQKDVMATIEHLRSRYRPDRADGNPNRERRLVLACWRCNNDMNKLEQAQVPLNEKRRRAGQAERYGLVA